MNEIAKRTQLVEVGERLPFDHSQMVGCRCPSCGRPINQRWAVAESKAVPGGQARRRVCPFCLADVITMEVVHGADVRLFVVNGVTRHALASLRAYARSLGALIAR